VLNRSQVFPIGEAEFGARNVALRINLSYEFAVLLVGNRVGLLPGFIQTGAWMASESRVPVGPFQNAVILRPVIRREQGRYMASKELLHHFGDERRAIV
jgi:hypothetical protein